MPARFDEVKKKVERTLGKGVLGKILKYTSLHPPVLWGEQQPRNYLTRNVVLALHKDISAEGYGRILNDVDLGFHMHQTTFAHNTQKIREHLSLWGRSTMKHGSLGDWKQAMQGTKLPDGMQTGCLYLDSTDFPKQKSKGVGPKHETWSYKLNRPGLCFMVLRDGKRRIRRVWGGYPPKVSDSSFLQIERKWFERNLSGAGIFADSAFSWEKKHITGVTFLVKYSKPPKKSKIPAQAVCKLTDEQLRWNKQLSDLRAKVENPFATMKNKFKSLAQPWPETDEQQEFLVWTAIGVVNACAK